MATPDGLVPAVERANKEGEHDCSPARWPTSDSAAICQPEGDR